MLTHGLKYNKFLAEKNVIIHIYRVKITRLPKH